MKQTTLTGRRILLTTLSVISISTFVIVWLIASSQNSVVVPAPLMVWERILLTFETPINDYNIFGHIGFSLFRVLVALFFAIIIGVPMGIGIGWNKVFSKSIGTLFELIRPIPPIAWLSIVIMWFGVGEFPKVLIVFYGMLMPIVINTYTGIKQVDYSLIDVGKSFRATNLQLLTNIAIPNALPNILVGFRNAIGAGWGVVVAAEMIGAKQGLGFIVNRGMEFFDPALIFVGILLIGIIGALLSVVVEAFERRACPWVHRKG